MGDNPLNGTGGEDVFGHYLRWDEHMANNFVFCVGEWLDSFHHHICDCSRHVFDRMCLKVIIIILNKELFILKFHGNKFDL